MTLILQFLKHFQMNFLIATQWIFCEKHFYDQILLGYKKIFLHLNLRENS